MSKLLKIPPIAYLGLALIICVLFFGLALTAGLLWKNGGDAAPQNTAQNQTQLGEVVQPAPRPVNQTPLGVNDVLSTNQDTALTIGGPVLLTNDFDPDGDALTVSRVDTAGTNGGVIKANGDGTYTYTPPAGFIGTDSFTYEVNDGSGGAAIATVTITVISVPTADTVTISRVDFMAGRGEWRAEGTGSMPGTAITIYMGPTVGGGPVLGTAQVDAEGNWKFRQPNSPTIPTTANATLSIKSSSGGAAEAFPVKLK